MARIHGLLVASVIVVLGASQALAQARWVETPVFSGIPDVGIPAGYVTGDLDGDGHLDLVAAGNAGGVCRLLVLLQAAGQYPGVSQEPLGAGQGLCDGRDSLALGDLDGDGDLDLVAQGKDNTATPRLLWFSNTAGTLAQQPDLPVPGLFSGAVALGDVDLDGDLDLAATGETATGSWRFLVLANDGSGTFALAQEPRGAGSGFGDGASQVFGDLDQDGDLDLVVSGGGAARSTQVYRNDGGIFVLAQDLPAEESGGEGLSRCLVRLADTDLDGDLDLVALGYNFDGTNGRWRVVHFANSGGTFGTFSTIGELSQYGEKWSGLALGDVDGNGFPDALVDGYDSGFVLRHYGNSGGTFALAEAPSSTFEGRLVLGDFDADGDLDFVGLPVRNLYENTLGPVNGASGAPSALGVGAGPTGPDGFTLLWSAPTDVETPSVALGYEVRLGTATGTYDELSGVFGTPLSGTHPPGRLTPSQPGRRLAFSSVPRGWHFWQARAIDSGLLAGPWSAEASWFAWPTLSVGDAIVTEADTDTVTATLQVTLEEAQPFPVTVDWATADGTAGAGADYVAASGQLSLPAGTTVQTIELTVTGDWLDEDDETFAVELSAPSGGVTIGDGTGQVTILDDDPLPSLSAQSVALPEGQSGTYPMYFTVVLSAVSGRTVTVDWDTVDWTATEPSDYAGGSNTLTFQPGDRTKTVGAITVDGDTAPEGDEVFYLDLGNPANATVATPRVHGTIEDDEGVAEKSLDAQWRLASEGMPTLRGAAANGSSYVVVGDFGDVWTSTDGVAWTKREIPEAAHRTVYGVAWGGPTGSELFVAVGSCGGPDSSLVLTSPDGATWTERTTPTCEDLRAVAWGNGTWVAVAYSGHVLASADAVTWAEVAQPTTQPLNAIAFGNGRFVAVGADRGVFWSTDGAAWTPAANVPSGVDPWLTGITWTGTQFVAVGEDDAVAGVPVMASLDGSAWVLGGISPDREMKGVASGGGVVVAVGDYRGASSPVFTSTNGIDWTAGSLGSYPTGVSNALRVAVHGPLGFVAGGDKGNLFRSADGSSPWGHTTLPASRIYRSVAASGSRYCAVGTNGALAHSDDGVSWAAVDTGDWTWWRAVTHTGNRFLAVGHGRVGSSTDCVTWTTTNPVEAFTASLDRLVDGPSGLYLALGIDSVGPGEVRLRFLRSANGGDSWAAVDPGLPASTEEYVSLAGVYGDGRFLVMASDAVTGEMHVLESSDGQSWTRGVTATIAPFDVVNALYRHPDGLYVAVGSRVWTSEDGGQTWTKRVEGTNGTLVAVTHADGRFVAVGRDGSAWASADGRRWFSASVPTTHHLYGLAPGPNGRLVAVGESAIVYGEFTPYLWISDLSISEGGSGEATVTLSRTSPGAVTAEYALSDASATAGVDYLGTSGTLTFGSGVTAQPIPLTALDDGLVEGNEAFIVCLGNETGASFGRNCATVTILDDEPRLTIDDVDVPEGDSGTTDAVFTVTLHGTPGEVTVDFTTSGQGGTTFADRDFVATSGTLSFDAGTTTRTIVVPVIGDTEAEGDEPFWVNLSNPSGATLVRWNGGGTILDDEPPPTISVADLEVREGNGVAGRALFLVYLSTPTNETVTVDYGTADGAARAGSDYTAATGTVTFWPGERSQSVEVPINPDSLVEGAETFFLALSNPEGAAVDRWYGVATILDDEGVTDPPMDTSWTLAREGKATTYGAASDSSTYVLVGDYGNIWTSPDGVAWTKRANPDPDLRTLRAVTWGGEPGNEQFVAVGTTNYQTTPAPPIPGPVVLTSPDGVTWTQRNSTCASSSFVGVAYGNGVFVAVGSTRIITSPDGVVWTRRTSGSPASLNAVAFGGGQFVAVGSNRTVLTSPDGVAWTLRGGVPSEMEANLLGVTWTGSQFVAVGADPSGRSDSGAGIMTSPDGVVWTVRTSPTAQPLRAATTGPGGLVVAVGARGWGADADAHSVVTSPDGVTWTARELADRRAGSGPGLLAVVHGPAGFLAAGGGLFVSPDGTSPWVDRTPPSSTAYVGVAHDGTRYCAVGANGAIATSLDGASWTDVATGPDFRTYWYWERLAWAEGRFVAVGVSGSIATSPDCQTWTVRNPVPPLAGSAPATSDLFVVAFGDGLWVAAGGAYPTPGQTTPLLLTSPDAITWTERALPLPAGNKRVTAVARSASRWVAFAEDVQNVEIFLLTSEDGLSWTQRPTPPIRTWENIHDVTFAEGLFVAVADGIWTSRDGISWSRRLDWGNHYFESVAHGDGRFAAVGAFGTTYSSPDGQLWAPQGGATRNWQYAAAGPRAGSRFVSVGASTIQYAEYSPSVRLSDASVAEGDSGSAVVHFDVTLSRTSTLPVTVSYATVDGTAGAGGDYQTTSGTLVVAPGGTSGTIDVTVQGDLLDEDDETFTLSLGSASNAAILDGQATGTIQDDDPTPTLSIGDVSVPEGPPGQTVEAEFAVQLSAASGRTVTVVYSTVDGSAVSGVDYQATSGVLTFTPGNQGQVVRVTVNGDATAEASENFFVNLSSPVNAVIGDGQGRGEIADDDTVAKAELTTPVPGSTLVGSVATFGWTAGTNLTRYWLWVGRSPGAYDVYNGDQGLGLSREVTALPTDGSSVWVRLWSLAGTTWLFEDYAYGTSLPALAVGNATVAEGDAGTTEAVFQVTLSATSGDTVTVSYATADGTAVAPGDYAAKSGLLTFPPGTTAQPVSVLVAGDRGKEQDETFTVLLSSPANAAIVDGSGLGAITDDDFGDVGTDLDGNGTWDLLWRNATTGENAAWLMDGATLVGGAMLETMPLEWAVGAVADLDGNGRADVVWRNQATGQTRVWFMNGTVVSQVEDLPVAASPWQLEGAGDFDRDGREDLLWRDGTSGDTAVWLMDGALVTESILVGTIPSSWVPWIGDLDGDGDADLLWKDSGTGQTAFWLMEDGGIASGAYGITVTGWEIAGLGDFDGDGKSDVWWRDAPNGANAIWFMEGTALRESVLTVSVWPPWAIALLGDLDGDGKTDVVWREPGGGDNAVWFMDAAAIVSGEYLPPLVGSSWQVALP